MLEMIRNIFILTGILLIVFAASRYFRSRSDYRTGFSTKQAASFYMVTSKSAALSHMVLTIWKRRWFLSFADTISEMKDSTTFTRRSIKETNRAVRLLRLKTFITDLLTV